MPLPLPFASADDASLVEGCVLGDADAWAMLERRYGAFVTATIVRALDAARAGEEQLDGVVATAWAQLRAEDAGVLRSWSGECQLRSWLAVFARSLALGGTPGTRALLASMPTPAGLFLEDVQAEGAAARVEGAIDKLPPNIAALVRLRLRGLSRDDIAATLGKSPPLVRASLERVAARLGEPDGAELAWRILLDAAEIEDRVGHAISTEDDAAYRAARAVVEKTWRAVGERALYRPAPATPVCLEPRPLAGFVDGTQRGAGRARAEGHIATCPRCIDEAAALVIDLRLWPALRDATDVDPLVAVAAACVATTRFAAAERLASRAQDGRVAFGIRRLAQAGRLLEGGRARPEHEASAVVATHLPDDDEAPLVAFEALVLSDPHTAWRAIDDHLAKQSLGGRLRMLAAAAGQDLEAARALAGAVLAQPSVDPGHTRDARAIAALPKGRALPREVLVERLRAVVPEAVRFVLTRSTA